MSEPQVVEESRLLRAARWYARHGWAVIPLHSPDADRTCTCSKGPECPSPAKHPRTEHGLKEASKDEGQVAAWWRRWPQANVGIVTGDVSGIVVLDVDPDHGGDQSLETLLAEHGELPDTLVARTGGGGRHFVFTHPGVKVRNNARTKLGDGLDVRGDGGYIVASPSQHASGGTYSLVDSSRSPVSMPGWLLERVREPDRPDPVDRGRRVLPTGLRDGTAYGLAALEAEVDELKHTGEGARNNRLNEAAFAAGQLVAGGELDIGWAEVELVAAGIAIGMSEAEVRQTVRSGMDAGRKEPRSAPEDPIEPFVTPSTDNGSPSAGPRRYNLTDYGNAERLVAASGEDLRYCHPWGCWLAWDGRRWVRDDSAEAVRRAKSAVRDMYAELPRVEKASQRKALATHAVRSEGDARIRAMLHLASSEKGVPVVPDDLDADPWLLNLANGTLDLRTAELRPHRRSDLITKLAPVDWDPDADWDLWAEFLDRVTGGDAHLAGFLQRAVGYSLTGSVAEQVLFVLHGTGANGKSTFSETVRALLGDYAQQTPADTLLERRDSAIPNDIARLRGARFISAVESEEGKRLAEGMVKQLTGGDVVTARFMRAEFFEFRPVGKIWLATNHLPRVRGTDEAIWRRIRLVPFTVTIPEDERDPDLGDKLRAQLAGVMQWAVLGCLEWNQRRLGQAKAVSKATTHYRAEQDLVGPFLNEVCRVEEGGLESAANLYGAYKAWAEGAGEPVLGQRTFGERLADKGFSRQRYGKAQRWHWVGVRIARDDELLDRR